MDVASLSWTSLGHVAMPNQGELVGFLGLDDGYVAFGNSNTGAWTSFSPDGSEWTFQFIAGKPCVWAPRFTGGASDGREAVILGSIGAASADPCETVDLRFAAWRSHDGQRWDAASSEDVGGIEYSGAASIWRTPSGWRSEVGESSDGLVWTPVDVPGDPKFDGVRGFGAPDGTALLLVGGEQPLLQELYVGADGNQWRSIPFPDGCEQTEFIAPPGAADRDAWVLFSIDPATTCVSTDLQDWTQAGLTVAQECGIRAWADSRFGIIATFDVVGLGSPCDEPEQHVSPDGLDWTLLASGVGIPHTIADGRAGVIGISGYQDQALIAWRLEE